MKRRIYCAMCGRRRYQEKMELNVVNDTYYCAEYPPKSAMETVQLNGNYFHNYCIDKSYQDVFSRALSNMKKALEGSRTSALELSSQSRQKVVIQLSPPDGHYPVIIGLAIE